MQTLKFISRGSAFNTKEGNNSAYFMSGSSLVLIDCGETIFKSIVDNNLLNNVRHVHVVITHLHSDHVGSLSSLIFYCYYIKKITITLHHPDKNRKLRELLDINGNSEESYYINPFNTLKCFENGDAAIFKKTKHVSEMDCYGVSLIVGEKSIYYSGDSAVMNLNTVQMNMMDEIYQDTSLNGGVHLSLDDLCKAVPEEYRSKVYCMHVDSDELIKAAKERGFNVVEGANNENN